MRSKISRLVSKPSFKQLHHFDMPDIWNSEFQVAFDSKVLKHGRGNKKWLKVMIQFDLNIVCWSLAEGSWAVHATQTYRSLSVLNFIKYTFHLLKFGSTHSNVFSSRVQVLCVDGVEVSITYCGSYASWVHSTFLSLSGIDPQVVFHYFWNAGRHPLKKTVWFHSGKH